MRTMCPSTSTSMSSVRMEHPEAEILHCLDAFIVLGALSVDRFDNAEPHIRQQADVKNILEYTSPGCAQIRT
jgi:hypothetical protein